MAELKTKLNDASVEAFLNSIEDEAKRADSFEVLNLMMKITKEKPKMWGASIVGFGTYHYKSPSTGREGDWFITGFSPRKANLTIYIIPGFKNYADILKGLGKHKTSSGSCLLIKKLQDVDPKLLKQLIEKAYEDMVKANKK
ncbi:MAG TPA: DUF1801 domain-containing protein [Candidatus Kapabacteria bacterium]|nr:DUF1801 domain-containing protein [Candidatus Kapabacteria bacterium]